MIIWRYGKISDTCDWTHLDQWIGERNLPPKAPQALREAIVRFIEKLEKR